MRRKAGRERAKPIAEMTSEELVEAHEIRVSVYEKALVDLHGSKRAERLDRYAAREAETRAELLRRLAGKGA